METLYLAVLISLLWVQAKTQTLQPFCLPGVKAVQCLADCKATECDQGLKVIGDMATCFGSSLTQYVNNVVTFTDTEKQQIADFIRTEVSNLKTTVATIRASLSSQPDSFFQNLISVSPTSLAAYIATANNALSTANSYQNGLCLKEVNTFQSMLKKFNIYSATPIKSKSCQQDSFKAFCLPGRTEEQCLGLCRSGECHRAVTLMNDMLTCLFTTLVNFEPSNAQKVAFTNFRDTELRILYNTVNRLGSALPTANAKFLENLISNSSTSLGPYISLSVHVRNIANSYKTGLCPTEVKAFQTLLTEYQVKSSDAALLRKSSVFNCIVLAILSTILLF
ncbi:hypothetical protein Ciccas_006567 [Cichlidogyrus casuarinus]|uniref:Uncharacterized protein n=1 Tax=Cichlidogyrus casuarinus TaxID=1844966 RepID=A0ABD2Q6F9_9PLAT